MRTSQQTTLRSAVSLSGIGVHSGNPVGITLHPREANDGIEFLRTGMPGGRDRLIKAHHSQVSATELCTVIGDRHTGAVATIEHLMSALRGLGIDNVLVEIDGPEMPILDGSSAPFVAAIDSVGIAETALADAARAAFTAGLQTAGVVAAVVAVVAGVQAWWFLSRVRGPGHGGPSSRGDRPRERTPVRSSSMP